MINEDVPVPDNAADAETSPISHTGSHRSVNMSPPVYLMASQAPVPAGSDASTETREMSAVHKVAVSCQSPQDQGGSTQCGNLQTCSAMPELF